MAKAKPSRPTGDELEAMRSIITANRGLHNRVLEKIRLLRALHGESAIDFAKRKQEENEKTQKTRSRGDFG